MRRLAARAPGLDIFGKGYVTRSDEGWEITSAGRDFLARLESITQDNLPSIEPAHGTEPPAAAPERGDLIVVGHRFRNRMHRPGTPARKPAVVSRVAKAGGENVSG